MELQTPTLTLPIPPDHSLPLVHLLWPVVQVDPYRDSRIPASVLGDCLRLLKAEQQRGREQRLRERLGRAPRGEPWEEALWKGDPWLELLGQLQSFFELALEEEVELRVIGD